MGTRSDDGYRPPGWTQERRRKRAAAAPAPDPVEAARAEARRQGEAQVRDEVRRVLDEARRVAMKPGEALELYNRVGLEAAVSRIARCGANALRALETEQLAEEIYARRNAQAASWAESSEPSVATPDHAEPEASAVEAAPDPAVSEIYARRARQARGA